MGSSWQVAMPVREASLLPRHTAIHWHHSDGMNHTACAYMSLDTGFISPKRPKSLQG